MRCPPSLPSSACAQGNLSRIGTRALLDTKLLEVLDRLVQKSTLGETVTSQQLNQLRYAISLLLMALLEGTDRAVEDRMLRVLDLHRIGEVAGACHERYEALEKRQQGGFQSAKDMMQGVATMLGRVNEAEEEEQDLLLDAGFALCIIGLHLSDFLHADADVEQERAQLLSGVGDAARAHYQRHIARIEIINATGELERVYFRFPAICLLLTEESKHELLWSVDRQTPGKRIQEFFEAATDLHLEMRHQEELLDLGMWRRLVAHKPLAVNAIFYIALVQNAVLILRYSEEVVPSDSPDYEMGAAAAEQWKGLLHPIEPLLRRANQAMGVVQVVASIVVFLLYAMQSGPVRQRKMWRDHAGLPYEQARARALTSAARLAQFALTSTYFLFTDRSLIFFCACLVAALLGLLVSPFWFAFHLLDVITKSPDLQNVFRAVTQNGRSILMTAFFGVIIVYLYAIIGLVYLRDVFVVGDYPDEEIPLCTTLPTCTVAALNEGLRGGDIGGFMEPRPPHDPLFYVQVLPPLPPSLPPCPSIWVLLPLPEGAHPPPPPRSSGASACRCYTSSRSGCW